MRRRIVEMLRKELLQTIREPRMRFFLFGPPMIQLLLFGYAVNLDLENTRIAWMDRDQTPHSRLLRDAFSGSTAYTNPDRRNAGRNDDIIPIWKASN